MPDVSVEITPQPSIVATVVGGDQISIDLSAGPPGPSGATVISGTLAALSTEMDSLASDFANWNVQLWNGAMRYTADINASSDGVTANWSQSGVSLVGITVPTFTLDVQRVGADLVLSGIGVGWSFRVRRYLQVTS